MMLAASAGVDESALADADEDAPMEDAPHASDVVAAQHATIAGEHRTLCLSLIIDRVRPHETRRWSASTAPRMVAVALAHQCGCGHSAEHCNERVSCVSHAHLPTAASGYSFSPAATALFGMA